MISSKFKIGDRVIYTPLNIHGEVINIKPVVWGHKTHWLYQLKTINELNVIKELETVSGSEENLILEGIL